MIIGVFRNRSEPEISSGDEKRRVISICDVSTQSEDL